MSTTPGGITSEIRSRMLHVDTYTRSPCSSSVHINGSGPMQDRAGCAIDLVHSRYVSRLETAYGAVMNLHRSVDGGFFPFCDHCKQPYPCTTVRTLDPSLVQRKGT